jgi:glutamine synthetase
MTESAHAGPPNQTPGGDLAVADRIERIQRELADLGIDTLLVQFTDLLGVAKGKLLPLHQLAGVLAGGAGFAGPSIAGTGLGRHGLRSEYYARGDLDALTTLPWLPGVARIVGSGWVDGEPFEACPRQILARQVARLAERGLQLQIGIEPEFFLLKREASTTGSGPAHWRPFDDADRLAKPSYDLKSLPRQLGFLQALRGALEAAGLTVLQIDHEDAWGQYEVNFEHDEVQASCDHLMLFKLAAQQLAEQRGAVFSMMAKPFADQPGSGLHFHVSLWEQDGRGRATRCVFDPQATERGGSVITPGQHLSSAGQAFVAGVLAHSAALCALAAPTVNSYKRLVVGESLSGTSWAPAYVAQGPNNRTCTIRTLPGRFEWRLPDAGANPYLAAAGLIAAGLDGLDRAMCPPPACTDDLFAMTLAQIRARGIPLLPQSLAEACDALEQDSVISAALGVLAQQQFLALKRDEALAYARHVSQWELERYAGWS